MNGGKFIENIMSFNCIKNLSSFQSQNKSKEDRMVRMECMKLVNRDC